ncbi:MAG: hypothetical protein JW709_09430 [Sedimentisphaerales bacterium]|nr:hypothetical protein [Sedimentisphaerales bacterium]
MMMAKELKAPERTADDWARLLILKHYLLNFEWDAGATVMLHYWRGDFYVYQDEVYRPLPEDELAVIVRGFLVHPKVFLTPGTLERGAMEPCEKVSARLIDEIIRLLKRRVDVFIPSHQAVPGWLATPPNNTPKRHMLNMGNGLLDLAGALDGDADPLYGYSARWFDTVRLPYDYEPQAPCPQWLQFLDEVFEGDEGLIRLLQCWCGYLLTPDTRQHKCLIAVGEGANGKSVLFRVVEALLGEQNVSHVPLEVFGERFALNATVGKLANIVSEVGEMDRVAEGRLKEFVAADMMTLDRKFHEPQTVKPTARLMLATNNLPRFNDKTGGIWRRIILLPFARTFAPHEQDRELADKLIGELPGILNWAIEGLKRLRTEGTFPQTPTAVQALDDYKIDCNPAREFLLEHYHNSSPGFVTAREVYQRYLQWCTATGHRPVADRVLGKEVRRTFPTVERRRFGTRQIRQWIYEGLQGV